MSTLEEKFVFIIRIPKDSLDFYIPLHGFNTEGHRKAKYDWYIDWGDGNKKNYTGLSSSSKLLKNKKILHNTNIIHYYSKPGDYIIIIRPNKDDYGWMRAWGFGSSFGTFNYYSKYTLDYSSNSNKIISFDYVTNKSFMESKSAYGIGYMRHMCCGTDIIQPIKEIKSVSDDQIYHIDDYFKAHQYKGCKNLKITENEYLPDNVTTIDNYFRSAQYDACIHLQTTTKEYLPKYVDTIGHNFRAAQYDTCINLLTAAEECLPNNVVFIGNWFRAHQYKNCIKLQEAAIEKLSSNVTIGDSFRALQYNRCTNMIMKKIKEFTGIHGNNFRLKQFGFDLVSGHDAKDTYDY